MPLTKEQKLEYLKDASCCPVCGSDIISANDRDWVDAKTLLSYVTCETCAKSWTETYKLTDVELDD